MASDASAPIRRDLRFVDSEQELLSHAARLKGLSLEEILLALKDQKLLTSYRDGRGKSGAGLVVEACFGIPPNPTPEPDFPVCGVELKTLPLVRSGRGLRVKERTSISQIDYDELNRETWATASVRKKLRSVLFVFVLMTPGRPLEARIYDSRIWHPDDEDIIIFEMDWTRTQELVRKGLAHQITESEAWALSASRKGARNDQDLVRQPNSSIRAMRRAFALKPSFTTWAFSELLGRNPSESVIERLLPEVRNRGISVAEVRLLNPLLRLAGQRLDVIEAEYRVRPSLSKNFAATIIKRTLGFSRVNSRVRELDELGIEVRVLNVRESDRRPWEAVSFPAISLTELVEQEWEDSELANQLHRVLFVPTYSNRRQVPQRERRLGRSFFWSPSLFELETIRREWTMLRDEVADGRARYHYLPGSHARRNDLTPASRTQTIHMRPHGRDAQDVDTDPKGNPVTRQCFWLNIGFIQGLLTKNDPGTPSPDAPGGEDLGGRTVGQRAT